MTTQISHNLIKTPYRKNAIINGAMQINQAGWTTATAVQTGFNYAADRFVYYPNDSTGVSTLTYSTDVPTYAQAGAIFGASLDVDITTALASPTGALEALIMQRIEGYNYNQIRGGNATFSCWIKTNKTGVYSLSIRNTGADRQYITEMTVNAADTWEKKTVILPLDETGGTWDYTTGLGLQVAIGLMGGADTLTSNLNQWITTGGYYSTNNVNLYDSTANYFMTTGWQLEAGDVATEFERNSYQDDLAACQRYYYNWTGTVAYTCPINRDNIYREFQLYYPVTMRAIPTTTISGTAYGGTFASTHPKVEARSIYSASCRGDVSVTGAYSSIDTFTATAEL